MRILSLKTLFVVMLFSVTTQWAVDARAAYFGAEARKMFIDGLDEFQAYLVASSQAVDPKDGPTDKQLQFHLSKINELYVGVMQEQFMLNGLEAAIKTAESLNYLIEIHVSSAKDAIVEKLSIHDHQKMLQALVSDLPAGTDTRCGKNIDLQKLRSQFGFAQTQKFLEAMIYVEPNLTFELKQTRIDLERAGLINPAESLCTENSNKLFNTLVFREH